MDRDLARHVASVAFKASSRLTSLIPLLKEHSDATEYEAYAKAIASIAAEVDLRILNVVFSSYPDLKREIEAKIKKYGELTY